MIHRLSANQPSFHSVDFTTGLNVVLGERSIGSTEKDTRNGIGKSTLIEIIDFCLGSRATKGKGLNIEPLENWSFTLEITLQNNRVKVTRSISEQNLVIVDGPTKGWFEQPETSESTGRKFYKVDRWRILLGRALFDIPALTESLSYKPSYRSLVSYFIRRGPDAYTSPFRHFRQQKTWDIQLHTAYLLGMNWKYAGQWQGLKDKEEGVKALEKAIKSGVFEGTIGTAGELETQRIQLERQLQDAEHALQTFKVHPQYESIQEDANRLTAKMHALANNNIQDRRRLTRYEESITEEEPPTSISLESLYEESGFIFPEGVKKTLHEARDFHSRIISNRTEFLKAEIKRIRTSINNREVQLEKLTDQRSKVLAVLKTHGALQEMTKLQEANVELRGSLDRVNRHLREIKSLRSTKREIKTGKADLVQTAERDHEDRREFWSKAVQLFNSNSQALYRAPGKLVIDVDDTGYKYQVDIERSGSEGIEKMKVFCFDLAVLQLQMETRKGIDFLIHDTLMFDAVDARQRALALEQANRVTKEVGAQYICTINSDMVPEEHFSDDFAFDEHVRLVISDASPFESLLGMRFERPKK